MIRKAAWEDSENDHQFSIQGVPWQMPLCQHVPACNGIKLVPSLAHILQACQGLDGLCLFLTQASWCVMPARMELVKLSSCRRPSNYKTTSQKTSKLDNSRANCLYFDSRYHATHPPARGSLVVMRQYHFTTACRHF